MPINNVKVEKSAMKKFYSRQKRNITTLTFIYVLDSCRAIKLASE